MLYVTLYQYRVTYSIATYACSLLVRLASLMFFLCMWNVPIAMLFIARQT